MLVCFNARTEAQRTQGEGAFNYRLKIPFSTETGTGEVNWRDVKLGGLFFGENRVRRGQKVRRIRVCPNRNPNRID